MGWLVVAAAGGGERAISARQDRGVLRFPNFQIFARFSNQRSNCLTNRADMAQTFEDCKVGIMEGIIGWKCTECCSSLAVALNEMLCPCGLSINPQHHQIARTSEINLKAAVRQYNCAVKQVSARHPLFQ